MKSNKKVFLSKDNILPSKNFRQSKLHQSFNFDDEFSFVGTIQKSIDESFSKTFKNKDLTFKITENSIKTITTNTQNNNNLKYKLTIKKRDTSSIGITKNVNYSNYIPSVF